MEGELPDLKQQERERKGAGLPLSWGAGSGGVFTGATGGLGQAGAAVQAALRSAAGQAVVARLTGTLAGQLLLSGAVAVLLSGSLALAHRAIFGTAASRVGGPAPDLGALTSSLRVRRPKRSRALDYLALAYKGELNLDATASAKRKPLFHYKQQQPQAPQGPAEGAQTAESAADQSADEWGQVLSGQDDWRAQKLARTMSEARVSDDSGDEFGRKDVFQDPSAPRFGTGFDRAKLAALPTPVTPPKRVAPTPGMLRSIGVQSVRVHAGRAITQLKASQGLSGLASGVSGEGATILAANAFEGQITGSGAPPATPIGLDQADAPPSGAVAPLGDGAPAPDATPVNATEYQVQLNEAYNLGSQAGDMKKQAKILMIIGLALIALGVSLLHHFGGMGLAFMLVGMAMTGEASMLTNRAKKLGEQAKQISTVIRRQYGQTAQADIVDECMDQAVGEGVKPQDCKYKTQAPKFESTAGAAAQEQMDATYTIDDSNGNPAKAEDLQSVALKPASQGPAVETAPQGGVTPAQNAGEDATPRPQPAAPPPSPAPSQAP